MILIAIWSWFSRRSIWSNIVALDFKRALAPISRASLVFWFFLVLATLGSSFLAEYSDLKEMRRGLGNFFVKYVLLWFVYLSFWWRVASSERNWKAFSFAYAFFSVVNLIYCVAQWRLGLDWAHGFGARLGDHRLAYGVYRVSGFMGHPLTLGYCLILALVASIQFAKLSERRQEKFAWSTAAICSLAVLFISGSRGPQLIALAACLLMFPRDVLKRRWRTVLALFCLAILVGWSVGLFHRFFELLTVGFGGDTRFIHWSAHWQMFKDHPWFGIGLGAPESAISAYYLALQASDNIKLAHNAYLQCAADFGIVGVFGLLIWLTAWLRVSSGMREGRTGLLVLFVVSVLGGMTQNNLQESAYVLGLTIWTMVITSFEVATRERRVRTIENQNYVTGESRSTD